MPMAQVLSPVAKLQVISTCVSSSHQKRCSVCCKRFIPFVYCPFVKAESTPPTDCWKSRLSMAMVKPSYSFCQHVLGRGFHEKSWLAGSKTYKPRHDPKMVPRKAWGKKLGHNPMERIFLIAKEGKHLFFSSRDVSSKRSRSSIWPWDQESWLEWKEERSVEVKSKWRAQGQVYK